jgi:hypothetical protein
MERLNTLLRKKKQPSTEVPTEESRPSKSFAARVSETLLRSKKSAPVAAEVSTESVAVASGSADAVAIVPEQASIKTLNEDLPVESEQVPAESPAIEAPKVKQDFMTRLLSLPRKRPAPKIDVAADESSQESKETQEPAVVRFIPFSPFSNLHFRRKSFLKRNRVTLVYLVESSRKRLDLLSTSLSPKKANKPQRRALACLN